MIGSAMFSDEFPLGNASVGENTLVFAFKEVCLVAQRRPELPFLPSTHCSCSYCCAEPQGEFIGEMAGTSEAEVLIFGGEGKAALPLGGWPEPKVLELRYVDMSG